MRNKVSACGRFVVLDGLHLDRKVFDAIEGWARLRGLPVQDAIQVVLCAFDAGAFARASEATHPSSARIIIADRPGGPTVG